MNIEAVRSLAAQVDTTAICDAYRGIRVVSSQIAPRSGSRWICAPAFTLRSGKDLFSVAQAIEHASPGDVVVIDGGAEEVALAGEIVARAAEARGLSGIIVDGGYRDMTYVSTCGIPVYSRFVTPVASASNCLGRLQVTVSCGGVIVNPGDIVVADQEGIVVLEPERAISVLEAALELKAAEAEVIKALSDGKALTDLISVEAHASFLENGQPKAFEFKV